MSDHRRDDVGHAARVTSMLLAGSGVLELTCALAAIALAIIGIAQVAVYAMASASAIVVGVGLVIAGAVSAARRHHEARGGRRELIAGLGLEVLAGLAGIVLASIGLASAPWLLPFASIALGFGLLFGGTVQPRVGGLVRDPDPQIDHRTELLIDSAAGPMTVLGCAAIVLGVLGVLGRAPVTLTMAATMSIAVAMAIAGMTQVVRFGHDFIDLVPE